MGKGEIKPGCEHVNMQMMFEMKVDGKFTRKAIFLDD